MIFLSSCFCKDLLLKMVSHCERRQKSSFCDMQIASTCSAQNNKKCELSLVSSVLTFNFYWNIYERQTRCSISHSNEVVLPYKEKNFQTSYMWYKTWSEEGDCSSCFFSGFWFPIVLCVVIYHRSLQFPLPHITLHRQLHTFLSATCSDSITHRQRMRGW